MRVPPPQVGVAWSAVFKNGPFRLIYNTVKCCPAVVVQQKITRQSRDHHPTLARHLVIRCKDWFKERLDIQKRAEDVKLQNTTRKGG